MNSRTPLRCLAATALAAVALLLAGCWRDRLVWSPDGTRAAIITDEGLHLCAADGKLTPLLAPGVYRAAWLADSQRLVLARSRRLPDYAALAAALGPRRTKALATKAEVVWQQVLASPRGEFNVLIEPDDDLGAIVVYLREHHGAALREKQSEDPKNDPKELEAFAADWHSLVVARLVGDRLEIGATLSEGLAKIHDLRPAPDSSAAAFVTHLELSPVPDDGLRLLVVPIDGAAPAALVASHTAAHPDWTPDSRTLVYLKAAGERSASKDLQLGALVERDVLDAAGHLRLAEKTRDLAGLIFQNENRVRCLRDGRVLFDAAEFHLPLAGHDHATREQLFALDRTKDAAALTPLIRREQLERMGNTLTSFEVSPDERQVLFEAGDDVDVLTLASGGVERVTLGAYNDSNKNPPLPVWRRPGELVYLKKSGSRNELVLRRGADETILSRTWPDGVLEQLVK